MSDTSVQHEQSMASDGTNQSGAATTTHTTTDQSGGGQISRSTTRVWSGKARGAEIVWLVAGVVVVFLALDFVFHAAGANHVGFASFVFAVGSFFAAPFAGIFNTSTTGPGTLVIWADVLAMVVYAMLAGGIAKAMAVMAKGR